MIEVVGRFYDRISGHVPSFGPQALKAATEGRGGIIHFDILPKNINKVVQATEAAEGDLAANLALLLPHVDAKTPADRKEWYVEGAIPMGLRKGKRTRCVDQAADRGLYAFRYDCAQERRYTHRYRRGPASDVGCTALPMANTAQYDHVWRIGNDGLWPTRRHRREGRTARQARCGHRR